MSTDQYIPEEADLLGLYINACAEQAYPDTRAEWSKMEREAVEVWEAWTARVRRDAAREALDGLAEHAERLAEHGLLGEGTAKIQRATAVIARDYRDTNHPEGETP